MPEEGDPRVERQSSWVRVLAPVQLAFAAFVFLHLACQGYRAATERVLPEAGHESQPWLVGSVLLAVFLPFVLLTWPLLREMRRRARGASDPQQRALAALEPVARAIVLVFLLLHVATFAWPLCFGSLNVAELRSELIAALSSTRSGLPLYAIGYLVAVGAAAFDATRQARAALPLAAAKVIRTVIALGVLTYVLGSYAVIRCASGSIWP